MTKETKPSVMIAMPCYDSVKVSTMISLIKLVQQLGKLRGALIWPMSSSPISSYIAIAVTAFSLSCKLENLWC